MISVNIIDVFFNLISDLLSVSVFLYMLVLITVGVALIVLFRLCLHFLIRLIGRREASSHPVKLKVDESFDFVDGWKDKEKEKTEKNEGNEAE